jgi:hypothetical protein
VGLSRREFERVDKEVKLLSKVAYVVNFKINFRFWFTMEFRSELHRFERVDESLSKVAYVVNFKISLINIHTLSNAKYPVLKFNPPLTRCKAPTSVTSSGFMFTAVLSNVVHHHFPK